VDHDHGEFRNIHLVCSFAINSCWRALPFDFSIHRCSAAHEALLRHSRYFLFRIELTLGFQRVQQKWLSLRYIEKRRNLKFAPHPMMILLVTIAYRRH
jgi:hypothetical protein